MPSSEIDPAEAPSLLRQQPFVLFWTGRVLSSLGQQAQAVTIAWQVYNIARDSHQDVRHAAFAVGMIGLAQFLPVVALTLPAGEMADRYDRRLIGAVCLVVNAATAGALALLALVDRHAIWPIYVAAILFGAARTFLSPANTALGPMLVPRTLLPRAIAWNALAWQSASIVGPALGGLLCAISPVVSFAAAFACHLASAAFLMLIRAETRPVPQAGSRWALVKEGLAYVWENKIVFGAISLDLFAVLLGGATALLPVFARDVLAVGAQGFGILRASPALGAACVAVVLASRPIRRRAGLVMFAGVALFGAATVVFALSKWLVLSVAALAVLGGADMLSVFVRQTLVQLVTPDAMRGRVGAVSTLFVGASNELGEFESGVAARFLGAVGAALFGGVGALIVTGLWAKLFPALRRADRLE
ncbi:MAG: MFS transporter [Caulobacteraceae bacterium]|nr:MFS transporter [Caulobacteraceae bacterium]